MLAVNTQNETWDVHRIKELTMSKIQHSTVGAKQSAPRRFRRGFTAIAAVITLVFATTALAVSGVIDFDSIFQSIFRNETAAPYVQTGADITVHANEGDVEVELIAAFWDDTRIGGLYLELEIHDPTGERLSDTLVLLRWDEWLGYDPITNPWGQVEVEFLDNYTLRAGFFVYAGLALTEARDILVRFDMIASGIQDSGVSLSTEYAAHTMLGNWEFVIPNDTALQAGIFKGYFEGHPTQVTLGATNVELEIFVGGFDIFQDNPLVLYLADGAIVEPRFNGAEGGVYDLATLQYSMDFIHPEDVVRVTFRGVEIGG